MGYFSDFIEEGDRLIKEGIRGLEENEIPPHLRVDVASELSVLNYQVQALKKSRIVKIPGEQLTLFVDLPLITDQDYTKLRSPFQYLYIEPVNQPVIFKDYFDPQSNKVFRDVHMKGVSVVATYGYEKIEAAFKSISSPHKGLIQIYEVSMIVPLPTHPMNTYIASFGVTPDGELVRVDFSGEEIDVTVDGKSYVVQRGRGWVKEVSEKVVNMMIHTLNYLTSPTVILEEKSASPELQKARQKRGKEPLPGWYEIEYTKSRIKYEVLKPGTGSQHSFRYDVRGHFMNFKKGRLAGRVIWCPPHQRGLKNALYKPKVYRAEEDRELPDPTEIYKG